MVRLLLALGATVLCGLLHVDYPHAFVLTGARTVANNRARSDREARRSQSRALNLIKKPHSRSTRIEVAAGDNDDTEQDVVEPPVGFYNETELYIVGAGHLGQYIARQWRAQYPEAEIWAETKNNLGKEENFPDGVRFVLRGDRSDVLQERRFHNVVFTATPSGNPNYKAEVFWAAAGVWDSVGMLVMVSSSGAYADRDGPIDEYSPIDEDDTRAQILFGAEGMAIGAGGCAVRLTGLYDLDRGPHNYWLKEEQFPVDNSAQGYINLLAYEDAASVVIAALGKGRAELNPLEHKHKGQMVKGNLFMACDGVPHTRRMICQVALSHRHYWGKKMPWFNPLAEPGPKRNYDCSRTREILGWDPRWKSFTQYFEYNLQALEVENWRKFLLQQQELLAKAEAEESAAQVAEETAPEPRAAGAAAAET